MSGTTGVSFVVPVHNGARWIRETLEAIFAQADGRPMEVIVVDDRSRDGSAGIVRALARTLPLRLIAGAGRGAAAAINAGVRAARYPIVCQVDQDVVVGPGWMAALAAELADASVGAAQGYYATDRRATLCARAMNLDLEQRYAAIDGCETDHVCTGNVAYRAEALARVGLLDEALGYGYDNDLSYRLQAAGYRLRLCRQARSVHRWREGIAGYLTQQYGFGYGRLDLVGKHPRRFYGDAVSRAGMMAHPIVMAVALLCLAAAAAAAMAEGAWRWPAYAGAFLIGGLAIERLAAGIAAAWRFGDATALLFPVLHLGRDLAWVAAMTVWLGRRFRRLAPRPSHSMRPRPAGTGHGPFADAERLRPAATRPAFEQPLRALCLIPAHNEASNLPAVVADVRRCHPDLDILVIDDGSTDATPSVLRALDVRWLRLPLRMGIGSAMRAGLRYAVRLGYDSAVRMDGDGQHWAGDLARLLAPLAAGGADVVLGSRYTQPDAARRGAVRLAQRILAACLSALTGRTVTDPTSGFCAFGPRAVRLLADHHPTGYGEPELRLFLSRNGLSVVEVPVLGRSRLGGRTSLTPVRLTAAGARVVLAMLIVPLRGRVGRLAGD